MTTLVGVFENSSHAQSARAELQQLGLRDGDIHVAAQDGEYMGEAGTGRDRDEGGGIGAFFRNLFGTDVSDDDQGLFSDAVRRGSAVVTVDVDEGRVESAAAILARNGAVDVDEQPASGIDESVGIAGVGGDSITSTPMRADTIAPSLQGRAEETVSLPVVEEELQVGTRRRQRGGVRVYTRVSSTPVEEQVTLREEQVRVERRPVDRAVTEADEASLAGQVVEVTTTAEEPVVRKEARVVEEVVIRKDVVEHEETVRDTVKRTDVEVEQLGSDERAAVPPRRETTH